MLSCVTPVIKVMGMLSNLTKINNFNPYEKSRINNVMAFQGIKGCVFPETTNLVAFTGKKDKNIIQRSNKIRTHAFDHHIV